MNPRHCIRLRLGDERSLPLLLAGVPAREVKLVPNDDDTYTLTVVGTVGDTRAEGRIPAADFLVGVINEFGATLNELGREVPPELDAKWDELAARWDAYNGKGSHTPADAYPERDA